MIMFCGGAVAVLEKSGSINAAFGRLASNKKLNAHVLALLIMAFMSVGGAAGVFANPVVALVPIGIILATSLGTTRLLASCLFTWALTPALM